MNRRRGAVLVAGVLMGRVLCIATLLLLAAAAMSAAQAQDARTIIQPHPREVSCGRWTKKGSNAYAAFQGWVLGFISGINFEKKTHVDFLRGRDRTGLTAWIDKYCRSNPLHPVTQAAEELVKVLQAER
jgi:hypothetical protein